jgi:hypothetical protein
MAWPHPHKNSTDDFMASQCGLQNFSLSDGVQLQAGLPHFFEVAIDSPPSVHRVHGVRKWPYGFSAFSFARDSSTRFLKSPRSSCSTPL